MAAAPGSSWNAVPSVLCPCDGVQAHYGSPQRRPGSFWNGVGREFPGCLLFARFDYTPSSCCVLPKRCGSWMPGQVCYLRNQKLCPGPLALQLLVGTPQLWWHSDIFLYRRGSGFWNQVCSAEKLWGAESS